MTLRSVLRAASPWRYGTLHSCPACGGAAVGRVLAPWVRWTGRAFVLLCHLVVIWILAALIGVLLASRADAQTTERDGSAATDTWTGDMLFRGERVVLRSCCGPIREPVIRRELEACLDVVRADLAASGHGHLPIPPLGVPEAPYTIEVVRDASACDKDCPKPGKCPGCSKTVHPKHTWTKVVVVDRARKRAAPVKHECRHRECVLLVLSVEPPRSVAEALALMARCNRADHGAGEGYRFDVVGRRVPK